MTETSGADATASSDLQADGLSPDESGPDPGGWHYTPALPIRCSPLFTWPWDVVAIVRWYVESWLLISERLGFVVVAVLVWLYLHPGARVVEALSWDWVALTYLRNVCLMTVFAGGLHLYLHTWKLQGQTLKYDKRDLSRKGSRFNWNDQLLDNMFWSLVSGIGIVTVYEVVMLWGQAHGLFSTLTWGDHPVWFVSLFVIIPVLNALHFYGVHRLLHWSVLYRIAHALHHRNVNIGPWSGISMHPIEHILYFSSLLVHVVLPSHPIHVFFHVYWLTLGAAASHSGYHGLVVRDKERIALGTFYHQLHHRYYECNYGNLEFPVDKWFGSFHDGTLAGRKAMKRRPGG